MVRDRLKTAISVETLLIDSFLGVGVEGDEGEGEGGGGGGGGGRFSSEAPPGGFSSVDRKDKF